MEDFKAFEIKIFKELGEIKTYMALKKQSDEAIKEDVEKHEKTLYNNGFGLVAREKIMWLAFLGAVFLITGIKVF